MASFEGRLGRPFVMHAADVIKADLIVMGSRRPELGEHLLGPNAGKVVRHARCSVMVVREIAAAPVLVAGTETRSDRLVAGGRFSASSSRLALFGEQQVSRLL